MSENKNTCGNCEGTGVDDDGEICGACDGRGKTHMGRLRKEFNWEEFDKLCAMWAEKSEIASFFDLSISTIDRRLREEKQETFEVYSAKLRECGNITLRRQAFKEALKDNTLLWKMMKHHLGYKDQTDVNMSVTEYVVDLEEEEDDTIHGDGC